MNQTEATKSTTKEAGRKELNIAKEGRTRKRSRRRKRIGRILREIRRRMLRVRFGRADFSNGNSELMSRNLTFICTVTLTHSL